MPTRQHTGSAGELAVASEFAFRGYNVAIPEIDKGDDLFVLNDATGAMSRIQVKTAKRKANGHFQFNIKQAAIDIAVIPDVSFVFALRVQNGWRFIILQRAQLSAYVLAGMGSANNENRVFTFIENGAGQFNCSGTNLAQHENDWSQWPVLP